MSIFNYKKKSILNGQNVTLWDAITELCPPLKDPSNEDEFLQSHKELFQILNLDEKNNCQNFQQRYRIC